MTRMRTAAGIAAGLAASVAFAALLAGCAITTTPGPPQIEATGGIATAVPVPKPIATQVSCPTGTLTLSKSNMHYRLDKTCSAIRVTGSSIAISAGDLTKLTITGRFDTVSANSVAKLTITADSDTVTSPSFGAVSVNGYYNIVDASSGTIASATLAGGNNTVSSSKKIPKLTQSGTGNTITPAG